MPTVALAQFIGFLGIDPAGAAGALTKISTLTASSSANLSFTGLGGTYNTLILDCNDMLPSGTNVDLQLLFGEGGGPTWETAGYYGGITWTNSTTNGVNNISNAAAISLTTPSAQMDGVASPTHAVNTIVFVSKVASTADAKVATYMTGYASGDGVTVQGSAGYYNDVNAITGLRVLFSSGNITHGQCTLYGLVP